MIRVRIDDIGASTKKFNQHGRKLFKYKNIPFFYFPLANFWFFKIIPPFKKWAKYDELTVGEWKKYMKLFEDNSIKPIVAITAAWVTASGELIPYPEKFPEEAAYLKDQLKKGKIEIANHGLTHCVVGKHNPRFFSSNREFHREFWPWLDSEVHDYHLTKSQEILETFFETPIVTFVPPGNVWSKKTYQALKKTNLKKVSANQYMSDSDKRMDGVEYESDGEGLLVLHDRDLKLGGLKRLDDKLKSMKAVNN